MERKIIGAGMLFVGSGCGPALSAEQQEFLSNIVPSEFYPVDILLQMLATAEARDPKIIIATARRWASALKAEFEKEGCTNAMDSWPKTRSIYAAHHQGDMGDFGIEVTGPTSVLVVNGTPYPDLLVSHLFAWFPAAFGADDVELTPTSKPHTFSISWTEE